MNKNYGSKHIRPSAHTVVQQRQGADVGNIIGGDGSGGDQFCPARSQKHAAPTLKSEEDDLEGTATAPVPEAPTEDPTNRTSLRAQARGRRPTVTATAHGGLDPPSTLPMLFDASAFDTIDTMREEEKGHMMKHQKEIKRDFQKIKQNDHFVDDRVIKFETEWAERNVGCPRILLSHHWWYCAMILDEKRIRESAVLAAGSTYLCEKKKSDR